MTQRASKPLSARLSWEEVHRLEVLMRTRAYAISSHPGPDITCPACGRLLGDDGMRLAGIRVHPGCLRAAATD